MSEEMKMAEQMEQVNQPQQETIKKEGGGMQWYQNKKVLASILAAAVVLIAFAAGIAVYNTPENRLNRKLDMANRYLTDGKYEEAALAFEEAIAIDERCMEAYLGGVEAYLGAGNAEEARNFYDRTLAMLSSLDGEFASANMDSIIELYLKADEVYAGDKEKLAQIWEEAYAATEEDIRVKEKLVGNYLEMGKEETDGGDYSGALEIYDRLLVLDSEDPSVLHGLCSCLNKYIDILMETQNYDEIRALAKKYQNVAADVDFASILSKIDELERIEAENREFMQMVYDLMAAQDYEAMHEIDGSEEAAAFVERMTEDRYIYFPEKNADGNGVGAGVYQFDEGGYYFYYGGYASGERKGNGTEFLNQGSGGYVFFTGAWDKDAPNGEGIETTVGGIPAFGGNSYNKIAKGMLADGLWNGEINVILTDHNLNEDFDLSFSAVNGVPTEDKTESFKAEMPFENISEDQYVFAYDYHREWDYCWWSLLGIGKKAGIYGFMD